MQQKPTAPTLITPTADIATETTHPFLLSRLYGDSVETVSARARANAEGCLQGGVLPVMKHIPGHGRANVDSHLGLPRVDTSCEDLRVTDFEVFRRLNDLPLGMSAHVVYSDIDTAPGTISATVIAEVRGGIGFDGLLMTDDISMAALQRRMGRHGGGGGKHALPVGYGSDPRRPRPVDACCPGRA